MKNKIAIGTINGKIVNRKAHLKSNPVPNLRIEQNRKRYVFDKVTPHGRATKKYPFKLIQTTAQFEGMISEWDTFLDGYIGNDWTHGDIPASQLPSEEFLFHTANVILEHENNEDSDPDYRPDKYN